MAVDTEVPTTTSGDGADDDGCGGRHGQPLHAEDVDDPDDDHVDHHVAASTRLCPDDIISPDRRATV